MNPHYNIPPPRQKTAPRSWQGNEGLGIGSMSWDGGKILLFYIDYKFFREHKIAENCSPWKDKNLAFNLYNIGLFYE